MKWPKDSGEWEEAGFVGFIVWVMTAFACAGAVGLVLAGKAIVYIVSW